MVGDLKSNPPRLCRCGLFGGVAVPAIIYTALNFTSHASARLGYPHQPILRLRCHSLGTFTPSACVSSC